MMNGPAGGRVYTLFPRLKERRSNMGGQLSGGERQTHVKKKSSRSSSSKCGKILGIVDRAVILETGTVVHESTGELCRKNRPAVPRQLREVAVRQDFAALKG